MKVTTVFNVGAVITALSVLYLIFGGVNDINLLSLFVGIFIMVCAIVHVGLRNSLSGRELTDVNHELRLDYYKVVMRQHDTYMDEHTIISGDVCIGNKGLDNRGMGMIYGYFPDLECLDEAILKGEEFLSPVSGNVVCHHVIQSREITPHFTTIKHSNYPILDDNHKVISS